jgi:hypothetical protein
LHGFDQVQKLPSTDAWFARQVLLGHEQASAGRRRDLVEAPLPGLGAKLGD